MKCNKWLISFKLIISSCFLIISFSSYAQENKYDISKSFTQLHQLSISMVQTHSLIVEQHQVKNNLLKLVELSGETKVIAEQLYQTIKNSGDEKLKNETDSDLQEIIRESAQIINHSHNAHNTTIDDFRLHHLDFIKSSITDINAASELLINYINNFHFSKDL